MGALPDNQVARTALFVAAVRARENRRSDRLFEDPLSETLAGPEGLSWLAVSETNPRSNYHRDSFPYLEVRTRFFDDWGLNAVRDAKARQLVVLGAGMDTRAFRLPWPRALRFWEVDTHELFALKEERLQSAGATAKCPRVAVEADLAESHWPDALTAKGFDKKARTVWIAEGLFQYLDKQTVEEVLESASSLSPAGSQFGAEIISADYLRRESKAALLKARKDRGTPWVFGTNDPGSLFDAHGWTLGRSVSPLQEAVALGRWPSKPRRSDSAPPGASFVSATKR